MLLLNNKLLFYRVRININSKYFYFLLFSTLFSSLTTYNSINQGDSLFQSLINILFSISIASLATAIDGIYIKLLKKRDTFYHILVLTLFSNIFIFNTLISGFNIQILSSVILIWSLYFYEIKNWKLFILTVPMALIGMGNPIIWGTFLTLYFFLRSDFKTSLFLALISLITAVLVATNPIGNTLEYFELGRNREEVMATIKSTPSKIFEILAREYFIQSYFDFFGKFPMVAINPTSWLIIIPNFLERFLSINLLAWSNSSYYAFILAPLATYTSILAIAKVRDSVKSERIYRFLMMLILIPALIFSIVQLGTSPSSKLKQIVLENQQEIISEFKRLQQ